MGLVYSNQCVPFQTSKHFSCCYFLAIIDDKSCYNVVYLLKINFKVNFDQKNSVKKFGKKLH